MSSPPTPSPAPDPGAASEPLEPGAPPAALGATSAGARAAAPLPAPGWMARLRDRDHTQGNLLVSVAVMSLPAIATSVFGFGLFQLFELKFLGELGDAAVAAAGSTNQTLRQVFMLCAIGVTVATQMMIAAMVGQGRVELAEHVAGQSFVLGAALAVIAALTVGTFPEFFVRLVARDPQVIALATTYVAIVFWTFAVMTSVQIFSSVLNGAGDATTPMLVTFATTPVSVIAQWGLAFGHFGLPELGIAGIALGSAVGGLVGVGVSLWALFSGRCRVHLRARHLVPDPAVLRRMLGIAWQPALHMVARSLMVFFFMWLAGRLGGKVQAAYTIGLRLEMLAIMVAFPVANGCSTLVGQNLGAGSVPRAWRTVWTGFAVELALLWPTALAIFWFRAELAGFFTQDPEVAAMAADYLWYTAIVISFYGLYFVAFRTLQAAGDMNSPMLISVSAAVFVGAPLGWFLSSRPELGATGMWIANMVYAILNATVMVSWLLVGRWAKRAALPGALPSEEPAT